MSDINLFENLSADQYSELKSSLPLITVLVAGADGEIDAQELNWAEKLTHIRSYAQPEALNSFYEDVEQGFHEELEAQIANLPSDIKEREGIISERLSGLNKILALLPNDVAYNVYESLTSFAEHIAKASGGFLRFGAVSHEEKHWINLPMITPIILEEPLEDEAE